jgi:hypothetical protein
MRSPILRRELIDLVIDEQDGCKDIVYYLPAVHRVLVENAVVSTKINKNKLLKNTINLWS